MAFIKVGAFLGNAGDMLLGGPDMGSSKDTATVIANSGVVKVGDVIATTTAAAGNNIVVRRYNAAGDAIVGILRGVYSLTGPVTPDSGTTDTWTMASDNETAAKKYAVIDITPYAVWSAPLSAAIHLTAIAGLGTHFDPDTGANAGRILESSATRTISNGRGLACVGVDPNDTTRALVTVIESVFLGAPGA